MAGARPAGSLQIELRFTDEIASTSSPSKIRSLTVAAQRAAFASNQIVKDPRIRFSGRTTHSLCDQLTILRKPAECRLENSTAHDDKLCARKLVLGVECLTQKS